MSPLLRLAAAILLSFASAQALAAAEIKEKEFTSFRDMHQDTEYGAWFINMGTIRAAEFKEKRLFREIVGMGEIEELPDQRGFCFVMNNFGSERPPGSRGELIVTLVKRGQLAVAGGKFVEETTQKMDPIGYADTADVQARNPPFFCVSQLNGVTEMEITIEGSVDGTGRQYILKISGE